MRKPTPEQQEAAQRRRANFRGMVKTLASMKEEQRAELAGRLPGLATCEGHMLSLYNQALIAFQAGQTSVTMLGGYNQWRRQGRQVKRGEHGFMIWIPTGLPKESELEPRERNGEKVRFLIGTVFDVSQTEEIQEEGRKPQCQPSF